MTEEKGSVTVPTGFIEVLVETTMEIPPRRFMFTPVRVNVRDMLGNAWVSESIILGNKRLIPITPGKFNIIATFGGVTSEPKKVEVKAGEVTQVRFRFGK